MSDTQACYAGNPHEYDEIKCSVCGATKALGIAEHLLDEIERVQAALARVLAKADAIEADGDGTPAATVARAIASEIRRAVNGDVLVQSKDTEVALKHDWKLESKDGRSQCSRCGTIYNGANGPEPCDSTKATFADAEQLAKIRKVIEIALSTESLKRSVVTREIADILGLPHEGPDPEARAFVERLKARLEKARE